MISVKSEVTIYEVNLQERDANGVNVWNGPRLQVRSHRIYDDRVVLVYGDMSITVMARDLVAAVANAQNMARH